MKQVLFADGIFNITVAGNLVRIDLGVAELVTEKTGDKQEIKLGPTQQIVMPLDGFVQAVGMQEQVARRLIKDGLVKMQPREAAPKTASKAGSSK